MKKWKLELFLLLFISIGFTACCSCRSSGDENIIKGQIVIVGHEPFTKVGLRITDEKIYTLKCTKELEKELRDNQGNAYAIQFSGSVVEEGLPVLIVEKALPLNQKNDE